MRRACRFGFAGLKRRVPDAKRWVRDVRWWGRLRCGPACSAAAVAAGVGRGGVVERVGAAVGSGDQVVGDQWVPRAWRLAADPAVGCGGEEDGAGLAVSPGRSAHAAAPVISVLRECEVDRVNDGSVGLGEPAVEAWPAPVGAVVLGPARGADDQAEPRVASPVGKALPAAPVSL